jgi:hypothetical protein
MKDFFFILLLLHLHGFLTLDIVTCNRGTLESNEMKVVFCYAQEWEERV